MTLTVWLDVGIGLSLLYLLLSVVASGLYELLAGLLRLRAQGLELGLHALLGSKTIEQFSQHPLIKSLSPQDKLPSYIPSRMFVLALLDLAKGDQTTIAGVKAAVAALDPKVSGALKPLIEAAGDNLEKARVNIETWFNGGMERVSGVYKRRSQYFLVGIAVALTLALNADTIRIASALYGSAPLRAAVVAAAEKRAQATPVAPPAGAPEAGSDVQASAKQLRADLDELTQIQLPIGWSWELTVYARQNLGLTLLGWLLTALAISMGAPFWFEILNRFMVIRSTVKPDEKSQPEKPKP